MPTQTITNAPWQPQQPYLLTGFQRAGQLLNQGGPQYPQGSHVAPLGADTQQGLDMYRSRAQAGSPIAGAANQQLTGTLQGDYLGSNPYLDSMYDQAAGAMTRNYQEAVAPSIGAKYGMSGRTGSGLYMNSMDASREQLGRQLGGLASNLYGTAYDQERNRQMQAAGMAPQTAELGYLDASKQLNVGNLMDQQRQRELKEDFERQMFNQERPYDNLGRYFGYLGGNYGSQQQRPIYENNLAQILGGVSSAYGLAQEIFGL